MEKLLLISLLFSVAACTKNETQEVTGKGYVCRGEVFLSDESACRTRKVEFSMALGTHVHVSDELCFNRLKFDSMVIVGNDELKLTYEWSGKDSNDQKVIQSVILNKVTGDFSFGEVVPDLMKVDGLLVTGSCKTVPKLVQ